MWAECFISSSKHSGSSSSYLRVFFGIQNSDLDNKTRTDIFRRLKLFLYSHFSLSFMINTLIMVAHKLGKQIYPFIICFWPGFFFRHSTIIIYKSIHFERLIYASVCWFGHRFVNILISAKPHYITLQPEMKGGKLVNIHLLREWCDVFFPRSVWKIESGSLISVMQTHQVATCFWSWFVTLNRKSIELFNLLRRLTRRLHG